MSGARKRTDVRVGLTDSDIARLDEQCRRFEWTRSDLLRYYIRQGYEALGEQIQVDHATQCQLFPITSPAGRRLTTPALPKAPPEVKE